MVWVTYAWLMASPLRIVVAEDEALIRLDAVEMLRECGYEVVAAVANGEAALAAVEQHHPDVVLMDIKMPVMDGLTAAAALGDRVPVVILSAFSQTELVDRARDAGVSAYLVKPFGKADLTPAIEMAVARWGEAAELRAEVSDAHERLEARKLVERAKGRLMDTYGLSEPDAFRWLQKAAMDRRMGLVQVAESVLAETSW